MVQISIDKGESYKRGLITFDPPLPQSNKTLIQQLRQIIAKEEIYFEGKPVLVDTFTDLKLKMEIILDAEIALGSLTCYTSKRSFPLHQAQFITMDDGPIVLYQGTLYFSSSSLDWSILKKCWEEALTSLTLKEVEKIKVLINEDLLISGNSSVKPTPVLKLDATGAFATLYFRYGKELIPYFSHIKTLSNGSKRDLEEEKLYEKMLLESSFTKKMDAYFCPLTKAKSQMQQLKKGGFELMDQKGRTISFLSGKEINWHLDKSSIEVKGQIDFEGKKVPLENVLREKERFFSLSSQEVAWLPDKEELGLDRKEPFEIHSASIKYSRMNLGLFVDNQIDKYSFDDVCFKELESVIPGSLFKGTLRPYQLLGLSWLHRLYQEKFSALLADDMGLGKTVQVLAFLSLIPGPHLIVMPKSLLGNWEYEIERFLPEKKGEIQIMSYHALRENIPEANYSTLILDEAQAIKNQNTKIFQAMMKVKSDFRLSLTGTPIENRLEDLISQFEFLLPKLQLDPDPKTLFKKLRPFILRRKKMDVLDDLPPRDDQLIFVEMTEDQKRCYDTFLSKNVVKIDADGVTRSQVEIFELILRLRQIAAHPLLVASLLDEPVVSSGKIERVLEDLNTCIEEGSKVLVFSQFTSLLSLVKKECSHPYLYLDGQTKDRQTIVDRFQEDSSIKVLFSSLKVGGVGLNLTEADYVFILDPWWNEAIEEQAISRSHRMGRTKPVISRRYISKGTIEEKMLLLKSKKKDLSNDLFQEDLEALLWT